MLYHFAIKRSANLGLNLFEHLFFGFAGRIISGDTAAIVQQFSG